MTPDADFVGGSMVEVVRNTSQLSAADREAMATYIKSLPAVGGIGIRKIGADILHIAGIFPGHRRNVGTNRHTRQCIPSRLSVLN